MMTMMLTMQHGWWCWLLKGVHLRFCNTVGVLKRAHKGWKFYEVTLCRGENNGAVKKRIFLQLSEKAWWVGCVKTTWCGLLKVQLARRSEDQVGQLGSHVEFAQEISSFASTEDWELENFYFQRPRQDLKFNLWLPFREKNNEYFEIGVFGRIHQTWTLGFTLMG